MTGSVYIHWFRIHNQRYWHLHQRLLKLIQIQLQKIVRVINLKVPCSKDTFHVSLYQHNGNFYILVNCKSIFFMYQIFSATNWTLVNNQIYGKQSLKLCNSELINLLGRNILFHKILRVSCIPLTEAKEEMIVHVSQHHLQMSFIFLEVTLYG